VNNFVLTGNEIHFQLVNNAHPSLNTTCSKSDNVLAIGYHECDDPQTKFAYDSKSSVLAVNQSWTCDDTNLRFVGMGNTTLDCSPNAVTCSVPGAKSFPGSLLSPVQITPKPVPAPPGADKPGCTNKSKAPAWEVGDLYYQRIVMGPLCDMVSGRCPPGPPLYYGRLEFDLVNAATDDRRHCRAEYLGLSDLESGYDDWLACDAGLVFFNLPRPPTIHHETKTFFRFNHLFNRLELNQTWYCNDLGDRNEYSFNSYGHLRPVLDQGVGYVGNTEVQQIRVNASSPSLIVPTTVVNGQKLAPNTLRRPQAFGRSCTFTSLFDPPTSFRISDFWFTTRWRDAKLRSSYLYMYVVNWMFNIELNFNAEWDNMTPSVAEVSDPNAWHGCNGGNFSARPGNSLLNCSFAFDRATNRLSVTEDWICADKDHEHP
jgi:hypothetical protein